MNKIIDVFDHLHEKMRISPDNILFISDDELEKSEFLNAHIGDVLRFLKNEGVLLRENRIYISQLSRIPIDHEKRLKCFDTFFGNPFFSAVLYNVWDFSSKEDFFKAYAKFKNGTPDEEAPAKAVMPSGLSWDKITIKFLSSQNVLLFIDKEQKEATAESMSLVDRRNGKPDSQWDFLLLLAKLGGEITWTNNSRLPTKETSTITKRKQGLSKALKEYFGINDDPFYSYANEKAYKAKFRLIPQSDDELVESDPLGIKASLKEQAPNVFDDDFSSE